MKRDWLWDRKISTQKVKAILKNPHHPQFYEFAALLLKRKNAPQEVFKEYLSPIDFCQNWGEIKKVMKKDDWAEPRIHFWQAVFEKTREKLKKKGVALRAAFLSPADEFCGKVGQKIKELRQERGLTQKELAKRLHIVQQIISRVESGRQNISLLTLKNIADHLQAEIEIELR